jgi:hypothetical protein
MTTLQLSSVATSARVAAICDASCGLPCDPLGAWVRRAGFPEMHADHLWPLWDVAYRERHAEIETMNTQQQEASK